MLQYHHHLSKPHFSWPSSPSAVRQFTPWALLAGKAMDDLQLQGGRA